jgi:hypothetical protein
MVFISAFSPPDQAYFCDPSKKVGQVVDLLWDRCYEGVEVVLHKP